jgi:dienelactone hydrolase
MCEANNRADVTGPETATKAILLVYGEYQWTASSYIHSPPGPGTECITIANTTPEDIFGFFDQTIQGADILATSNDQKYRVYIPDFFEGSPADISWYPPTTDEHKQKLGNFFQTQAAPPKTLSKIPDIVKEANQAAPGGAFQSWSILGFCWGGKIAALSAGADNKIFKAAAQCHPAMVDPNDAKTINVPFACLASKDEPADDVKAFKANLTVPNHVETFSTQIHGWMAARSDLEDPEVVKEYERGYKTVLDFFHSHA